MAGHCGASVSHSRQWLDASHVPDCAAWVPMYIVKACVCCVAITWCHGGKAIGADATSLQPDKLEDPSVVDLPSCYALSLWSWHTMMSTKMLP